MMQTTAIYVSTLCVPCYNRCRYCLLSWNGNLLGAEYQRCADYGLRFYNWLRDNRPELGFQFYFGYSMEHPSLMQAIDFMGSIGSVGGRFLQMDGLKFRSAEETAIFLQELQAHGIQTIDLTIYGTQEYHDRFAGRQGDFAYLLTILREANRIGLAVNVSIPLTAENAGQAETLLDILEEYTIAHLFCFIPHSEGRGATLDSIRLTEPIFDRLHPRVEAYLNRNKFRTEREWLNSDFSQPDKRVVALSLTPENIEYFEQQDFANTIKFLEKLDEDYYAVMPSLSELAARYGDPMGQKLYSERDLYLHYQRRYIQENSLTIYDINDERQHFSRRFS